MKVKLDYNETSLIVNALSYYATFAECCDNEDFKKRFKNRVFSVIEKFELLENQILQLSAEKGEN